MLYTSILSLQNGVKVASSCGLETSKAVIDDEGGVIITRGVKHELLHIPLSCCRVM